MEPNFTKPLKKIETLVQKLTQAAIPGGLMGLDIDLIFKTMRGWAILEFLRCETVRPADSHPRRYWDKNWRKFVALKRLRDDLKARLFLVNFETLGEGFGDFYIFRTDPLEEASETKPLQTYRILHGDFQVFKDWLSGINQEVVKLGTPFCFYCQRLLGIDFIQCQGCAVNICHSCADIEWKLCESCL